MPGPSLFWTAVFILHCAWVGALPGLGAKALACIGATTSLLFLAAAAGTRIRERLGDLGGALSAPDGRWRPLLAALFLLPAVSLVREFTAVFWQVNGRVWLALAWVICLFALGMTSGRVPDRTDNGRGRDRRAATASHSAIAALFVAWSSILWLTMVLDLGVRRFTLTADRSTPVGCTSDVLTSTFSIWETTPASEHLFLSWRTAQHFTDRLAYENHVAPYLMTMYAWMTGVRAVTGFPLFVAANTTPILYMVVLVSATVLLWRRVGLLARCQGPLSYLALFFASATIVTTWRFWHDLYRYNTDSPYPLIAAVFVAVYALLIRPRLARASTAASALFVALSPIHLPMLVLAVGCIFGRAGRSFGAVLKRNRLILRLLMVSAVVGVTTMGLPRVLVAWRGYPGQGSSLLYRTGLDGSTAYLTDLAQAVWSACPTCCGPRPITQLLFPAAVPLLVFLGFSQKSREVWRLGGYFRFLLFLTVPYWMSAVVLPQSVAVHPYLYDHLLLVPIVVTGATAMLATAVNRRVRGPYLLVFLLLAAAVIMSNLLEVAQAFSAAGAGQHGRHLIQEAVDAVIAVIV